MAGADPFFEDDSTTQAGFDPLALLRMFWRRKWLFIVPFVLCLTMALVAIKTMTPIYYSGGQIRVVFEQPTSRMIDDDTRYTPRRDFDREALITIDTIITGPKFLETIVSELGLHRASMGLQAMAPGTGTDIPSPAELEAISRAAGALKSAVRVDRDGAHVFSIGVRDTDPERALLIARQLMHNFLAEERARRMARRSTTRDFLERQRQVYQERLDEAEQELTTFQRSMVSVSLAGNPINYQNLAGAELALSTMRDRFNNEELQEFGELERQARTVLPDLPNPNSYSQDPEIAPVVRELVNAEFAEVTRETTARGDSPLGRTRIRLNSLIETRTAANYPRLGVLDRGTVSRYLYFAIYRDIQEQVISRLARNIGAFRDFTTRQPEQSSRLTELQQEVTRARELLESIESEITQQTMNLEATESEIGYRIEVRRDPKLPTYPIEPNKMKLGFMGFVLSLAIGAGLVVLSILLDRSFTSVAEIERSLGLSVIGTLPVIQDEHFQRKRRLKILRWIIIVVLVLGIAAIGFLYVYPRLS